MATYDSLSAADKQTLQQGQQLIRGWWKLVMASDLTLQVEWLTNHWKPLKDGLDAGEIIPNESGLAGAQDLTREDSQVLYADMKAVRDDVTAAIKFDRLVKAIGYNAGTNE